MTVLAEAPVEQDVTEYTLDSQETFAAVQEAAGDYHPRQTEAELGLLYTKPEMLHDTGRHVLLTQDETVQPGGNYKSNGAFWKVAQVLRDWPEVPGFYVGSAGNAGAGVVAAASAVGKHVTVETPDTLVASKRALLETPLSTVHSEHASVEQATAAALARAEAEGGVFIHPYDDLDMIAGQSMVGMRAVLGLLEQQDAEQLDLTRDPVTFLVQRGGGSLLTGVACAVYALKQAGLAGDNVRVLEVRPEESEDLYDGLKVAKPGHYAQSILDDSAFVQGTVYINDEATGRAANRLYKHYGKRFEPSGMAGVAAFEQLRANTPEPTVFVTVLSGANTSDEAFQYFAETPARLNAARQEQVRHLGGRTLAELQAQTFDKNNSRMRLLQHAYGRYPAAL